MKLSKIFTCNKNLLKNEEKIPSFFFNIEEKNIFKAQFIFLIHYFKKWMFFSYIKLKIPTFDVDLRLRNYTKFKLFLVKMREETKGKRRNERNKRKLREINMWKSSFYIVFSIIYQYTLLILMEQPVTDCVCLVPKITYQPI